MATITKNHTFTAGTTILSAEVNANFDTIYNDYNGGITNANISGSAAIADSKLAQITTASKVSGAALTSLTSIPTQTATTADSFQLTNNSITTGRAVIFDSSTTVLTGAGRMLLVDHVGTSTISGVIAEIATSAVDETVLARLTASGALTGVMLDITGSALTTGTILDIGDADSLTTGKICNFVSDSASTAARSMVLIDSTNTASVNEVPLTINQDSPFVFADFTGTAGATTTDPISTHNTSGAVTDHIRIRVNGTDAWIPISTNTPGA